MPLRKIVGRFYMRQVRSWGRAGRVIGSVGRLRSGSRCQFCGAVLRTIRGPLAARRWALDESGQRRREEVAGLVERQVIGVCAVRGDRVTVPLGIPTRTLSVRLWGGDTNRSRAVAARMWARARPTRRCLWPSVARARRRGDRRRSARIAARSIGGSAPSGIADQEVA
jgi:hypothetical protein